MNLKKENQISQLQTDQVEISEAVVDNSEICGKNKETAQAITNLTVKLMKDNKIKPICSFCENEFGTKYNLLRHLTGRW